MLTGYDPGLIEEWYTKGPEIDPAHLLTIRSIKLNCDGALVRAVRGYWSLTRTGRDTMEMKLYRWKSF